MKMGNTIRIGSRASPLAMRQAALCREALLLHVPEGTDITLHTFQTSGDAYQAGSLSEIGNKGLFTKEIEQALLRHDIDVAVHSMKDVATRLPEGLMIPSVLPRDDVRDVLLCDVAQTIDGLPEGAVVGTSSLRRAVQLRWQRPDVQIVPYRGNIQRRMHRLEAGDVDATLLAVAGLQRMGVTPPYASPLSTQSMLPAVAQGAIGLQCREDDVPVRVLLEAVNHAPTLLAVETERHFLACLDGSCKTPIAGLAQLEGDTITLEGVLADPEAVWLKRSQLSAALEEHLKLAETLADQLRG